MRIYFSGIGGVGIGPLALIAHEAGYDVTGSDREDGLMTAELRERGIAYSLEQSGDFLRAAHHQAPIDWFVYTSALPAEHPELLAARELGLHTAKRDELLAHIITQKDLQLIAIAGTHGKTTTTGMMIWALQQLGEAVSYSIGTTLSWGPSGHYAENSRFFVYECDEFDRNFLHFSPEHSLITSIEHDHADTYPTAAEYYAAFGQFIGQSHTTIAWRQDIAAHEIEVAGSDITLLDKTIPQPDLQLAGQHNRENAALVLEKLQQLGFAKTDSIAALNSFPGTQRRFEKLADNLYSDYGHTPTEIAATLQMARELSEHVVLVYQPHQNVRQHEILHDYIDSLFADADAVLWLPTYLSRELPDLNILAPETLTAHLHTTALSHHTFDATLWQKIEQKRQAGALVLCMGAGTIDGWVRQQLANESLDA